MEIVVDFSHFNGSPDHVWSSFWCSRYQKCVNLIAENVVTAMPWLNNYLVDKQWLD